MLAAAYMSSPQWGHVAEWLRNGLQNRVHRFNSGRGLQQTIWYRWISSNHNNVLDRLSETSGEVADGQQDAHQPSGKGSSGQA